MRTIVRFRINETLLTGEVRKPRQQGGRFHAPKNVDLFLEFTINAQDHLVYIFSLYL